MTAPTTSQTPGTSGVYKQYGTEVSLYSGKTRAYFRYKGIPFEEHLATRKVYKTVIMPNVRRPIIPVVETPQGDILQDTTVIIDALEQRFPDPSIYPQSPWQRLVAMLLEVYGDEWLVMPAMHYRWHFKRDNLPFILREFGRTAKPEASWVSQLAAGVQPALMFGNAYRPYFGITRKNRRAIEKSYEAFLRDFDTHLAGQPFLLGTRPSIGDFGLIAPLYAHLYRDPYPSKLMKRLAPRVASWVERMQWPEPEGGEFLPDDEVPNTLYPLLARMFREQLPVLVDTMKRMDAWAADNPGRTRVPRVIGRHTFTVEGVSEKRCIIPFSQWMFQRPLRYYQSLSAAERERIDPVLKKLGGYEGLNHVPRTTLDYLNHRLVVANPTAPAA